MLNPHHQAFKNASKKNLRSSHKTPLVTSHQRVKIQHLQLAPHQLTSPKPRLRDSCNTQKKKEYSAGRSMKSKIQIKEVTIAPISWHPSLIKRWTQAKVAVLNSIKKVHIPFCTLATLAGLLLKSQPHSKKIKEEELSDRTRKRCTVNVTHLPNSKERVICDM